MYGPCIPGVICGSRSMANLIVDMTEEEKTRLVKGIIQDACSHPVKEATTIERQRLQERAGFAREVMNAIREEAFETPSGDAILLSDAERIIRMKI